MEPLIPMLNVLAATPTGLSASLGAAAVIVLLVLKMRNHGLESITSISKLQSAQVQELMAQNRELAHDLSSLRGKMAETLNELSNLRHEVATLKYKLNVYETYCHDCDRKPRHLP